MSYFIRKIEKSKWMQNKVLEGQNPSADAITGSLRTRDNTLSIWHVNDHHEIEDAVLAFISQGEHLDTIDIVIFSKEVLNKKKLQFTQTKAKTPYLPFADRHYDIHSLDYVSLGEIAMIVVDSLKQDSTKRFTRGQLKRLVTKAIENRKIHLQDLHLNIQNSTLKDS